MSLNTGTSWTILPPASPMDQKRISTLLAVWKDFDLYIEMHQALDKNLFFCTLTD